MPTVSWLNERNDPDSARSSCDYPKHPFYKGTGDSGTISDCSSLDSVLLRCTGTDVHKTQTWNTKHSQQYSVWYARTPN